MCASVWVGVGSMGRDGVLGVDGSQPGVSEEPSPRDLASAQLFCSEPYWVLSTSYVTWAGIHRNLPGAVGQFLVVFSQVPPQTPPSFIYSLPTRG